MNLAELPFLTVPEQIALGFCRQFWDVRDTKLDFKGAKFETWNKWFQARHGMTMEEFRHVFRQKEADYRAAQATAGEARAP